MREASRGAFEPAGARRFLQQDVAVADMGEAAPHEADPQAVVRGGVERQHGSFGQLLAGQ
ncbi:MAG: hypothetical protein EOP37_12235 [Rubrivivax sp.]|nr:MAG: hypothetical protein EOP37_12235 [Rubrivivax sp.]